MKKQGRRWMALLLSLLILGTAACGKKNDPEKPTEKAAAESKTEESKKETEAETTVAETVEVLDYENMTEEDLLDRLPDRKKLSLDDIMWLMNTYSYTEIAEDLTIPYSITQKALSVLWQDSEAELPPMDEIIGACLQSELPQVRAYGIELCFSIFGLSDENSKKIKTLLETEKEPYVLKSAIEILANQGGRDKDVADFLMKMSEEDNVYLRASAADAIGRSWNIGMEGAVDKIIEMMSDPEESVRKQACEGAGDLADDRVIAPLEAILMDEEQSSLHGACMDSISFMWLNYPYHETSNEAAYRVTLEYIRKTPRSEDSPQWTCFSELSSLNEDKFEGWKALAPFYNKNELIAACREVALDPDADYLARTGALKVIAKHGTLEDFSALQGGIDGLTDGDADQIKRSYEEQLKSMQAD